MAPILDGVNNDLIKIPPRCEVIRKVYIENAVDTVIKCHKIVPGVFVSSTVVDPINSYVRVLYITDDIQTASRRISSTSLRDFNILSISTEHKQSRVENLRSVIKQNTQSEILNSLCELCENFNDIFTLESDQMNQNNFYEQKFRLWDDNSIYIKN